MWPKPRSAGDNPSILNQIGRQFSDEFRVLLDASYYQGTKFAEFYNVVDAQGVSNIYVPDPHEADIARFDTSPFNEMKFLVGLTAMGKTTLIRNYYRITDRDVQMRNDEYVVYVSYYDAELSPDIPYESVISIVVGYLSRFIEKLFEEHHISDDDDEFYRGFYAFVEENKSTLVANRRFVPGGDILPSASPDGQTASEAGAMLRRLCESRPLEYHSSLLKYALSLIGRPYKVTFIFDDMEAKDSRFHIHVVEAARHMFSCFNATSDGLCTVKVLVSLRAYTFRCNVERNAEARREVLQRDVILKRGTVPLSSIFDVRFQAIFDIKMRDKGVGNQDTYNDARRVLAYVQEHVDEIEDNLIYNLENYNLCDAMVTYSQVLTNLEWMACDEEEVNGAFKLDEIHYYRTTRYDLMRAIGMGNSRRYDGSSESLPNLVRAEVADTELLPLYVVRYLRNFRYADIYGTRYVEGKTLFRDLVGLFCGPSSPDSTRKRWHDLLGRTISFMYERGLLFRSLYDIETEDEGQIRRRYFDTYKLYLAPRGDVLYRLLANNSVLLELYRDAIEGADGGAYKPSVELGQTELFEHLLALIEHLFDVERRRIGQAVWNIHGYIECVGDHFVCEHLLSGVVNSISLYYRVYQDDRYHRIASKALELISAMEAYACEINKRYGAWLSVEGLALLRARIGG